MLERFYVFFLRKRYVLFTNTILVLFVSKAFVNVHKEFLAHYLQAKCEILL